MVDGFFNSMNVLGRIVVASDHADGARGVTTDDHMTNLGRCLQEVLRFQIASGLDLLEQLLCLMAVTRLVCSPPSPPSHSARAPQSYTHHCRR